MHKVLNVKERRKILDSYFKTRIELDELNKKYDDGAAPDNHSEEELLRLIEEKRLTAEKIREEYLEVIPDAAISRCPFTGSTLIRSIDLEGIDGLWWDYYNPARRKVELLPTFFAMDGAVKFAAGVEQLPFSFSVGPEVPFVLPRLLKHAAIKAVLSSLPIGGHRAYFITYYSEPMLSDIRRVNDLGTYCYEYSDKQGLIQKDFYQDPAKDFELEDWINTGKLLWIEPDDLTLTLRSYLSGCPYLNLPGSRKTLAVINGDITEAEEPGWILETSEFLPDETDDIPIEEIASVSLLRPL